VVDPSHRVCYAVQHYVFEMRFPVTAAAVWILFTIAVSTGHAASGHNILGTLFCDLTSGSKPYKKSDCICIEFIDNKNMATFGYRKGAKSGETTYSYEIQENRIMIDMRGDGGLDHVELTIKSVDTIVSRFIESRNRAMLFTRQARLPEICW